MSLLNFILISIILFSASFVSGDDKLITKKRFNPTRVGSNYTRYFETPNPGQVNPLRLAGPWRGEGAVPFRLGAFAKITVNATTVASTSRQGVAAVKGNGGGQQRMTAQAATNKAGSNKAGQGSGGGSSGPSANMSHQGGPVMVNGCNVFLIFYGDWSTDQTSVWILEHLTEFLGGSRFYDMVSYYYSTRGEKIINQVTFVKSVRPIDQGKSHSYKGTEIKESAISEIVTDSIEASLNPLPVDSNGLYMVVTAANIKETSGMCSEYCGWHDSLTIQGQKIQYGFLGCPKSCPSNCAEQVGASPNGSWIGDAMASILFHEIIEAATDPHGNAWYDKVSREEIADTCAWMYGETKIGTNSEGKRYKYNTVINGRHFLLQQVWVNEMGCMGGGQ